MSADAERAAADRKAFTDACHAIVQDAHDRENFVRMVPRCFQLLSDDHKIVVYRVFSRAALLKEFNNTSTPQTPSQGHGSSPPDTHSTSGRRHYVHFYARDKTTPKRKFSQASQATDEDEGVTDEGGHRTGSNAGKRTRQGNNSDPSKTPTRRARARSSAGTGASGQKSRASGSRPNEQQPQQDLFARELDRGLVPIVRGKYTFLDLTPNASTAHIMNEVHRTFAKQAVSKSRMEDIIKIVATLVSSNGLRTFLRRYDRQIQSAGAFAAPPPMLNSGSDTEAEAVLRNPEIRQAYELLKALAYYDTRDSAKPLNLFVGAMRMARALDRCRSICETDGAVSREIEGYCNNISRGFNTPSLNNRLQKEPLLCAIAASSIPESERSVDSILESVGKITDTCRLGSNLRHFSNLVGSGSIAILAYGEQRSRLTKLRNDHAMALCNIMNHHIGSARPFQTLGEHLVDPLVSDTASPREPLSIVLQTASSKDLAGDCGLSIEALLQPSDRIRYGEEDLAHLEARARHMEIDGAPASSPLE